MNADQSDHGPSRTARDSSLSSHGDHDGDTAIAGFLATHGAGGLAERLGIDLLEIGGDRTVARMPVAGNTQPLGLLHGGASAALAETVASLAAACRAPSGHSAVGIELNATHHRSLSEGTVTAVAEPIHVGRRVASYQIAVTDDATGNPVSTVRLTCMFVERR